MRYKSCLLIWKTQSLFKIYYLIQKVGNVCEIKSRFKSIVQLKKIEMNLSRLKIVTFDMTNTLLKLRTSPGKQYGEIGAMYGISCDKDQLVVNFKKHLHRMGKEQPNFGLYSGTGWEKWWKDVIVSTFRDSKVSIEDERLEAVSSYLIEAYKTSICWQPCYGTIDLLNYLQQKDLCLGVISNFDPRIEQILTNTKLRHYFRFVVYSYEVGAEKPDEKMFKEAMQRSRIFNVKPNECLHVGDEPINDYQGAIHAGWQAVVVNEKFNRDELLNANTNKKDLMLFSSLSDFHKYLVKNV